MSHIEDQVERFESDASIITGQPADLNTEMCDGLIRILDEFGPKLPSPLQGIARRLVYKYMADFRDGVSDVVDDPMLIDVEMAGLNLLSAPTAYYSDGTVFDKDRAIQRTRELVVEAANHPEDHDLSASRPVVFLRNAAYRARQRKPFSKKD